MSPVHQPPFDAAEHSAARQSNSLAALAVTLLLVVLGLYLVRQLRTDASVQDCVLSGRTGCMTQAAPALLAPALLMGG